MYKPLVAFFIWIFLILTGFSAIAQTGPQLNYHGRIVDGITNLGVTGLRNFRIQVRTPAGLADNCLMYEETQSKNLVNGVFVINLNNGSGARADATAPVYTLQQIFSNKNSFGSFTFAGSRCVSTNPFTYTPTATDSRRVNIWFEDPVGAPGVWEPLPTQTVAYVPSAIESLNVGGFPIEALLRVVDVTGNPSTLPTPMSEAQYTNLMSLTSGSVVTTINGLSGAPVAITGTSGTDFNITTSGSNINFNIPTASAANRGLLSTADWTTFNAKMPNTGAAVISALGYTPLDPANNLSEVSNAATARGNLGLGTSATMNVPAVAAAAAATTEVVRGDDPRLTGAIVSGSAASGDLSGTYPNPSVATVGGRTAVQINQSVTDTLAATDSVTASTIVKRDASGNASFATAQATNFSGNNFYVFNGNTESIRITAPTPLPGGDYILTLPDTSGTAGYVLSTDGAGNTSWIDPSGTSVTAVNADPPLSSSGGFTPTISIAQATTATAGYLSSTDWTTFNDKLSTTLGTGQVWVGSGANVAAAQFLNIGNIQSSVAGAWFNAGACAAGEILSYSAVTDQVTCTAMTLTGSQVATALNGIMTGDATITAGGVITIGNGAVTNAKISSVDWSKVANTPTTYGGYGITDITLANAGNVNTVEAGLDAARGAFGTLGRVYFSTDSREVWYDTGAAWLRVGSNAGLGGTVTSVAVDPPLSLSGVATVNPTISLPQASVAVDGYLSSADFTTFSGKLDRAGDTMTGALNMGSNNITAVGNIAMSANRNIQIGAYAADPACTAPDAGKVWYHTPSGALHYCDGTIVQSLGSLSGVVTGINGLTGAVSLVLGSAGTDASINTASPNITLNLPTSSAANRGLLSSTDWSDFNSKQAGSTELTGVAALATTGFVQRTGAGTYATVSSIDLTTSVSGSLPISNGGTNATTANAALNNLLPNQATNGSKFLQTDGTNTTWADISAVAVTSVTAAATANNPIVIAGTATAPTVDIPMATAAVNGYLASTDFTTFNSKQSSSLATGQVWVGSAGAVATAQFLNIGNIKSTVAGNWFNAGACASGEILTYSAVTDQVTCAAMTLTGSQVATALSGIMSGDATISAAGTLTIGNDKITAAMIAPNSVAWSTDVTGKPTTIAGYGITDAILVNGGGIATMEANVDASRGAAGTVGRVYVSRDTGEIWYDTGATWVRVGSNAGLGGTVTNVTGTAPISVATGTSTPVVSMAQAAAGVDGYLASTDFTTFNNKLGTTLADGNIWIGNGSNTATAVVMSGDASISNTGALTLATVSTAGTYTKVTIDTKGRVTSATNINSSDVTTALGYTPVNKAGDTMSGALNMGGQNLTNTGVIEMASNGNIQVSNRAADPAGLIAADAGRTWFNSTTNELKYWNGSSVQTLGTLAGVVTGVNGLTGGVTLNTGTTGTDFNISTSSPNVTFNFPTSSAANRGLLSSADWSIFSSKQAGSTELTAVAALATTGFVQRTGAGTYSTVSSIDLTTSVTGALPVANGGTGATTAGTARTNLGLGSGDSPTFTGLTVSGVTGNTLLRANGSGVIANATSADITSLLGFTPTSSTLPANMIFVGDGSNVATAVAMSGDASIVSNGTITLKNTGTAGTYGSASAVPTLTTDAQGRVTGVTTNAYQDATGVSKGILQVGTNLQVAGGVISLQNADASNTGALTSADWTTFNNKQGALGFTPLNAANNLSDVASADVSRTNLGLGIASSPTFTGLTLSGLANGFVKSVSGVLSGGNTIALSTDVTGVLPVANGGTGLSTSGANGNVMYVAGGTFATATPDTAGLVDKTNAQTIAGVKTFTANPIIDNAGVVQFREATGGGTNYVGLKAPAALAADVTFTLPPSDGTVGQVLKTDGAGNLDWISAATGTVTSVTSANTDIGVATTTTTPVLTLNSGLGANQIAKVGGSAISNNTVVVANGSGALAGFALTNGQLLIGSTGAAPVAAGITGTANQVTVTNGAGTITLSTPQDIHSGASPSFTGLTLSGITGNTLLKANGSGVLSNATSADVTTLLGFVPGAVSNVSGTAPISVATGTSTPVVSITKSTAGVDGYLAAADFTLFAAKMSSDFSNVTGTLGIANGGTGGTTAATARTNLGVGTGDSPSFTGLTVSGVTGNTLLRANGSGVVANATSTDITTLLGFVPASNTLATNMIFVGDGSNVATAVAMSGDASIVSNGTVTLKNTGTAGTYGSASAVPTITTDAQGRVTGVTTNAYQDATGVGKGIVQVGNNISVAAGVISVATADGSTTGVITSADWTTFNSKLSATIAAAATGQYIRYNGANWVNALMVSSDVTTSLGYTPLNPANNLSDVANAATSRTNLGVGTGDSPSFTGLTVSGVTGNTLLRANGSGVVANATSTDITGLLGFVPGVGTVTNVTGTAPISVATGTSTPAISIARSTAGVDGYLAATDFTIFAAKMSSDFSNASGTLGIANGGTGAATAANARTNLGVGTGDSPSFTGLTVSGVNGNTLVKTNGSGVLSNATSADVTTLLGFVPGSVTSIIVGTGLTGGTITTTGTIGLGTELAGLNSLATTGFIQRTGSGTYATVSSIDLTTSVTGALPIANGGTGATTAGTARTNLGLGTGDSPSFTGLTLSGVNGNTLVKSSGAGVLSNATSADITTLLGFVPSSATLATNMIFVGDGSNIATAVAMSGDASIVSNGTITLKNTGTAGTYGSASAVPTITTDAQGRVTGVTTNAYQDATGATKGIVQAGNNISVAAGVISVATADGSTTGVITSGDWTRFDSKLSATIAAAATGQYIRYNGANWVNALMVSSDITTSLGYTPLNPANNLSDVANAGTSRTNLGLGTGDSPSFTGLTVSGVNGNTLVKSNGSGVLSNATSADVTTLLGFTPGSVTSVTSANTDIGVATTATTPVLTLNSGLGANQIAKVGGSAISNNTVVVANGSGALAGLALTNGQLLIGSTGAAPVATGITGTANQVTVTNGAGTITLSAPQDIHSGASPSFTGLTVSGVTGNTLLRANGSGVVANATSADITTLLGFTPGVGTVTSIIAGTGLTGGTITGSGTIGLGTELSGLNGLATLGFIQRTAAGTYSTVSSIDLTTSVTGTLPIANGGTGATTAGTARTNLGVGTGDSPSFTGLTVSGVTGNTLLRANGSGVVANATSADITTLLGFVPASNTLATNMIFVGDGSNIAAAVAMSGDASIVSNGTITLKNTGTAGTYGSASAVPTITTDAQGRVAGVTTNAYQDATGISKGIVQAGNNISVAAGVISVATADGSTTGVITSADWTTFNNKQSALGFTPLNPANNLSDVANAGTSRTNLGLGTGDSPSFTGLTVSGVNGNTLVKSSGAGVLSNATSADVTTLLGFTPGVGTVTSIIAGTGLTGGTITGSGTIGLDTELAGLNGLATLGFIQRTAAGTYSTVASIDLTTSVTGTLPIANGGTGGTTAGTARTNLGVGTGDSPSFTGLTVSGVNGNTLVKSSGAGVLSNATSADITSLLGFTPGSVTSVTSANTDISIATTTSTPVLTLNSGLGADQIAKVGGSAISNNTVVVANGSGALAGLSLTNGQLLIGSTGAAPVAAGITGTANQVTVTNGAGTITLATPQDIHSGASPSFTGLTVSGVNGNTLVKTNGSGVLSNATSADVTTLLGFTPGSVTSIIAGTGLTGGTITGSGTIGLDTELAGLNGLATTGFIQRTAAGTYSTVASIDLTTSVTGTLPIANGGTNATTANAALNNLLPAQSASSVLQSNGTNTSWLTFNTAASNNSLVQRDGSGITQAYGVGISGATSGSVTFTTPGVVTTYSLQLPAAQGGAGTVLQNNGSGVLTWAAAGSASSTDLTNSVTGILPVANGGTGLSSGTSGGIPYFSAAGAITSSGVLASNGVMLGGGAGATPTTTAAGAANEVLRIPGGGGAPVFGSIDLSSTAAVTNSLAVGNGGTGASTLTSGSLVVGNGTSAVNFLTAGTLGNVIYATGAATWASGTPTAAGLVAQGGNSYGATMNIGTGDANQLNIKTNGSTRMSFDTSGAVQVTGQAYSLVATSSSATPLTWDTNSSNTMRWTINTSTITANIHNMKPGAAYQLIVSGSGTGTTTINCFSDAGVTALTQGYMPANGNRVTGTRNKTVYTLMSDGESCLVTWITGF